MWEQVQLIEENGEAKFAVIPFAEYLSIKSLLSDEDKLVDYLDYLHMQKVKKMSKERVSLAVVKETLSLD